MQINYKKILITSIVVALTFGVLFIFYYYNCKKEVNHSFFQKNEIHAEDDIESDLHSSFFVNKAPSVITFESNDSVEISHIKTPDAVKGLYMTSWVAGTNDMRDHVIHILVVKSI